MPINVSISKEQMLQTKIVQPGVYVLNIADVYQQPAKTDPDSMTNVVKFIIESGPDASSIGVPILYYMGEKHMEYQVEFLQIAFGKKLSTDGIANLDIELLKGRKIKAYVKSGRFNGRDKNEIQGFMPLTS